MRRREEGVPKWAAVAFAALFPALAGVAMLAMWLGMEAAPADRVGAVVHERIYVPCAVPQWEDVPEDLEESERRLAVAAEMMERCGAKLADLKAAE